MRSEDRSSWAWVLLCGCLCVPLVGQTGFGGLGGFGSTPGLPSSLNPSTPAPADTLGFAPFAGIFANYSRELSDPSLRFYNRRDNLGGSAMAGISGSKSFEHTAVSLGLVGSVNYYSATRNKRWNQSYTGHLNVAHAVNSRLDVYASGLAGSALGGYGAGAGFGGLGGFGSAGLSGSVGLGGAMFGSVAQNGLVDAEVSNLRTNFTAAQGGLSYRLTERWYASGGGGAAWVGREGGFFGERMNQASGQLSYLFNRRTSIGLQYGQSWINYSSMFGGVTTRVLGMGFESHPSERTALSLFAGVGNMHSEFIGRIALPPEVAELLGTSTAYEQQKVHYYTGAFGGSYSYSRPHHNFSFNANRMFVPGNGALLASTRDSGGVNYGYSGPGRLGLNASFFVGSYNAVVGPSGHFIHYQAMVGTGLMLAGNLHFNVNGGYRIIDHPASRSNRGMFASVGLTWSPQARAKVF